jgi:predicted RNA-binding protein with PIN domain
MPDCDHLLIDGYNLIHAFPEWKRWLKSNPERARDLLADWVRVIHDMDEVETTLVFDGRGPDLTVERPFQDDTFSILFSPSGMTADTVIEQLVGKAKNPKEVLVGTDDRILQHTTLALGAQIMGMKELEGWVSSCERRLRNYLK